MTNLRVVGNATLFYRKWARVKSSKRLKFAVLQPFTHIAGTASGLFFFIQMAIAAISGWLLSGLADGTAQPMIWLTVGASIAFGIAFSGLRSRVVTVGGSIGSRF